jgi:hypothetical protein
MKRSCIAQNRQSRLPNTSLPSGGFGLTTLTALVITGMIGSGVFVTSGFALEALGSRMFVLAAWLLCVVRLPMAASLVKYQNLVESISIFPVHSIHFVDFLPVLFP